MQESTDPTFAPVPADHPMFPTYEKAADSGNEEFLSYEIVQLWETHRGMQCSVKEKKKDIQALGKTLGEALFHMKRLLAKPGRDGRWSSFLKEHRISRATADRLVTRYQQSLDPNANRLNEAISEPTQEEVQKVFNSVWPRLRRVLTTPGSVYQFVLALASACGGLCFQVREDGILVPAPATQDTDSTKRDAASKADRLAAIAGAEPDEDESSTEPCSHDGIVEDAFVECL